MRCGRLPDMATTRVPDEDGCPRTSPTRPAVGQPTKPRPPESPLLPAEQARQSAAEGLRLRRRRFLSRSSVTDAPAGIDARPVRLVVLAQRLDVALELRADEVASGYLAQSDPN